MACNAVQRDNDRSSRKPYCLDRLILKETPVSQGQTGLQIKNIYYDGVRRVQENITRPDLIEQLVMGGGGQQQQAEFAVEGEVANDELAVEIASAEPIEGGESPPQTLMAGGGPEEVGEVWTDRQYIYGPDYVDEFVCQLDRNNTPFYMLQDANYNVVAILSPTGQVRTQYTYEPYGLLVAVEHPSGGNPPTPVNRVGHQGLFYDRYDGDYSDLTIAQTNLGLYYNRNRFYSPMLGRFIQRDPNETGMPVVASIMYFGQAIAPNTNSPRIDLLYLDGQNIYQYQTSNPANSEDPLGLILGLIDLGGSTGLMDDMNLLTLDMGMGIMDALRGLIGHLNYQNLVIVDMLGSTGSLDGSAFDSVLGAYSKFQTARNTALGAGLLSAGLEFAYQGFREYAKPTLLALGGKGFKTFDALKRFLGSPGPGRVWHHVVEQSQIPKFGADRVQNSNNIIAIPSGVNSAIANFYSSKQPFSMGMTVREWLRKTASFQEQYEFGIQQLRRMGQL